MADAGEVRIDISEAIVEEVIRVLREKFQWSKEALLEAELQMNRIARRVTPTRAVDVVKEDPDDSRILECAAEASSDYVVTGDKDLLRVGTFGNIKILRVAELLDLI